MIDSHTFDKTVICQDAVKELRASVLLMGACLAKFGEVTISYPGGCSIGKRPIDFHIHAFQKMGAERIVPARELSLEEIKNMKNATGLEIECFVHGALCYCYSGQCLMSSMIGGRSGNRGECAQPCRLPYRVENRKSADLMSLKDLCTIDMIPELVEAGIDSFKIEGRMKQPDYVYTVAQIYRKYTDIYLQKERRSYGVSPG